MLIGFVLLAIVAVCGFYAWHSSQPTFTSKVKDGAEKTVEKAKDVADVNNDGKVSLQDAVQVAKNVKAEAGRVKRKYGGKVKKAKKTEA